MSNQRYAKETVKLDQLNEDLTAGLERCHDLVDETRSKLLAVNADTPFMAASNDRGEDPKAVRG